MMVKDGELLGYTKEDLLKIFPDDEFKQAVERNEKEYGALIRYLQITFKDNRKTLFIRYENACVMEFENLEGEKSRFSLSREAMTSLFISYQFTQTPQMLADEYENFKRF